MQASIQSTTEPVFKKQAIFMLDPRDSKVPTYIMIAITYQGGLQIVAVRFKELSAQQLSFEDGLNLIESIGVQTYLSDRSLPVKLFQMKSIQKLFDYFSDEANRVIRASTKAKNESHKMILEPMVHVSKNIHDFVPLQLDLIDSNYMAEFTNSKRAVLAQILQKMRQDERERMEEAKGLQKIEEQRKKREDQEEKQAREQQSMSSGEIDWPGKESKSQYQQTCQDNHRELQVMCENSNILLEEVENHKQEKAKYQYDMSSEEDQMQLEQTGLEEHQSVDQEKFLQSQYTALLQEQNQQLKRVIDLQTQLIKKTFKLQLYEELQSNNGFDSSSDYVQKHPKVSYQQKNKVQQSFEILQRKYQTQIHQSIESVEKLRKHLTTLKQYIFPTSTANKLDQPNDIAKMKKTLNKNRICLAMNKIQEIFESL